MTTYTYKLKVYQFTAQQVGKEGKRNEFSLITKNPILSETRMNTHTHTHNIMPTHTHTHTHTHKHTYTCTHATPHSMRMRLICLASGARWV